MGDQLTSSSQLRVDPVKRALLSLESYIHREHRAGYDPYDCLKSPLFSLPLLRSGKSVRLAAQQLVRRIPVNLRPLLRIPKGKNPVTFGLCLKAYSSLFPLFPEQKDFYSQQVEVCLKELTRLRSAGYSGACWGYEFDWDARYARIPAFMPTIVATSIVGDGLYHAQRTFGNAEARALLIDAGSFVTRDLQRTWEGDTFCFSYSPRDRQTVINATLKGARLLCQVFSLTSDTKLLEDAKATVAFALRHQHADGRWSYSAGDSRTWSDNFHTGYVLDCLDEYSKLSGDRSVVDRIAQGFEFYHKSFFSPEGIPGYYHDRIYPIDATAIAQSILTLTRFGEISLATKVAHWAVRNMQDEDGHFYYRRYRAFTNRISYMRWSNAWMYAALARLLEESNALVRS